MRIPPEFGVPWPTLLHCPDRGHAGTWPRKFINVMPFAVTKREKVALSVMAMLIVLGLIGMALL